MLWAPDGHRLLLSLGERNGTAPGAATPAAGRLTPVVWDTDSDLLKPATASPAAPAPPALSSCGGCDQWIGDYLLTRSAPEPLWQVRLD